MKDILFISHSNPEDNEFTLWLASRLRLMGYTVWCDIEGLLGGEITWDDIDELIRNKSIKFLLVVSKHLCKTPGKLRKGVQDEFRLAESLSRDIEGDFVIPLKIDDVPHNFYIGLNTYNNIPFFNNWADGFNQLIKKLEKDNVTKTNRTDNKAFVEWYENEYMTKYGIINKKETYFSNWLEIGELPKYLYIFQYENEDQAKEVSFYNKKYPKVRYGNIFASFEEDVIAPQKESPLGDYTITYKSKYIIDTGKVLEGEYKNATFPTMLDCEKLITWLLNAAFDHMMMEKYLFSYEMSRHKKSYYFPRSYKEKVTFQYKEMKKTKNVNGVYDTNFFWHAGISGKAQLSPVLAYSLKSHIWFSNDGEQIWDSSTQLHSARRKKGKRMYNKEWREQLFAFINALKDDQGKIEVDLSKNFTLTLPDIPFHFSSEFGYNEPQKDRQAILQEEEIVEELQDEINEDHEEKL